MSTVQTIYDSLAYRRDIQVTESDLIPVVNLCIRAVGKRLYELDSDLITDEMSVNIFSEQTYTASMACVASPPSITDAANQFVVEAFAAGMPITTTQTSNPGPFRIVTVAVGTLTLATTDVVVAAGAGSFAITSDDAYGYLPSDFWGLKTGFEPYLSGYTTPLVSLPSQSVALSYPNPGFPEYYKIKGSKIYVTPHTSANYTIIADYYKRPTAVSATSSTMPWNEQFDGVISEAIVAYLKSPMDGSASSLAIIDAVVKDGIDLTSLKYDRKAGSTDFPQRVDWSFS